MDQSRTFDNVADVYDAVRPGYLDMRLRGPPPETWYLPSGPLAKMFDEAQRFLPVSRKSYPWTWSHTAASYSAFARTRSQTQFLAPDRREALVAAIGEAIEAHGGRLDMCYEAHLYMARRRA